MNLVEIRHRLEKSANASKPENHLGDNGFCDLENIAITTRESMDYIVVTDLPLQWSVCRF